MSDASETWAVYLLRCSDGSLYCGIAKDAARRLSQHNKGTASRYTRGRRPVEMIYQEPAAGKGSALQREVAIKRMTRRQKLRLVVADPTTS